MTKKEEAFKCCHECKREGRGGGCHDVCNDYQTALAKWNEYKETVRKAKYERMIYENYHFGRILKQRKINENKKGR